MVEREKKTGSGYRPDKDRRAILSKFLKPFVAPKSIDKPNIIYSVERFRSVIEHEKIRSDRSNHVLSLLVFDTNHLDKKLQTNKHLEYVIAGRIRSIDVAGWLDNRYVGVLLPYTSMTGARRLADDICQTIAAKACPPQCTVYTYPFYWFFDNNGQATKPYSRNYSSKQKTAILPSTFADAKHSNKRENAGPAIPNLHSDKSVQDYVASTESSGLSSIRPSLPLWKRTMDIIGALLSLILLSPVMFIITVIIKLVSPGPAFFRQLRVGYMGKTFTMLKFRTMKVDTDTTVHKRYLAKLINGDAHNKNSTEPMTKLDDNLQITPFGKFLRWTYLDELPQLINVLRGEMTLVGPRPPIPYEVKEYLPWHKERIDVVPGMTGLWQVSGKNQLTFNEMVRLDVRYWRKKTLWLDMKILLMTPIVIFSQIKNGFGAK
jgi:lipopolysaccharide/colanic/teichoic acid biosynthesis glycosyltransferase